MPDHLMSVDPTRPIPPAEQPVRIAALVEARARGAKDVNLSSRPSREAANRLYERLGFQARDTNVYRYTF